MKGWGCGITEEKLSICSYSGSEPQSQPTIPAQTAPRYLRKWHNIPAYTSHHKIGSAYVCILCRAMAEVSGSRLESARNNASHKAWKLARALYEYINTECKVGWGWGGEGRKKCSLWLSSPCWTSGSVGPLAALSASPHPHSSIKSIKNKQPACGTREWPSS